MCACSGDVFRKLGWSEPAPLDQNFERDEQRIAGEGRDGGIGRGAVTDGIERQHLPEALFGRSEEVGEGKGGGSEVTDAACGVERRDVKEKAGGAIERHSGTCRRACGAFRWGGFLWSLPRCVVAYSGRLHVLRSSGDHDRS